MQREDKKPETYDPPERTSAWERGKEGSERVRAQAGAALFSSLPPANTAAAF